MRLQRRECQSRCSSADNVLNGSGGIHSLLAAVSILSHAMWHRRLHPYPGHERQHTKAANSSAATFAYSYCRCSGSSENAAAAPLLLIRIISESASSLGVPVDSPSSPRMRTHSSWNTIHGRRMLQGMLGLAQPFTRQLILRVRARACRSGDTMAMRSDVAAGVGVAVAGVGLVFLLLLLLLCCVSLLPHLLLPLLPLQPLPHSALVLSPPLLLLLSLLPLPPLLAAAGRCRTAPFAVPIPTVPPMLVLLLLLLVSDVVAMVV